MNPTDSPATTTALFALRPCGCVAARHWNPPPGWRVYQESIGLSVHPERTRDLGLPFLDTSIANGGDCKHGTLVTQLAAKVKEQAAIIAKATQLVECAFTADREPRGDQEQYELIHAVLEGRAGTGDSDVGYPEPKRILGACVVLVNPDGELPRLVIYTTRERMAAFGSDINGQQVEVRLAKPAPVPTPPVPPLPET